MSPEQFLGQVVDARTDIYSAGVLFYQLLTGERPFEGGLSAIMHKALNTEPPSPSQISVTAPPSFDAVVRRAMAKRREDRFPSAWAFATAMRAAFEPCPVPRPRNALYQASARQASASSTSGLRARQISSIAMSFLSDAAENATDTARKVAKAASAEAATKCTYRVWYATNRRPVDPGDSQKGYTAYRDTSVHYGSCHVFIPAAHKIGSVGSPWWKRLWMWRDDRLRIRLISGLSQERYWSEVSLRLSSLDRAERHALIFIHGYNVSFNDAAIRAAQIGVDLGIQRLMAFFSWPSQGTLGGYNVDEATIEASETVITDFISDFAERSAAKDVHIIGHSMGNRGLMRAIGRIAAKAERQSGKPFNQIILAAADVDADSFRQFSAAYAEVCNRTTLYVSTRDRAVEASRWLHKYPRVGLTPPTIVLPGIDTINVTNADITMLGHGYVAAARDVLHDMHALIRYGTPPDARFGLRAAVNEEGLPFWLIGA
jgi:esterase/lipase superfamily enzyme